MPFRLRFKVAPGVYYTKSLSGSGRRGSDGGSSASGCLLILLVLAAIGYFLGPRRPQAERPESIRVVAPPNTPVSTPEVPGPPGSPGGFGFWTFALFVLGLAVVCGMILLVVFGRDLERWAEERKAARDAAIAARAAARKALVADLRSPGGKNLRLSDWASSKGFAQDVAGDVARDLYAELSRRVMDDGVVTPDERAKLDAVGIALELPGDWRSRAEKDALDGVLRVKMGQVLAAEVASKPELPPPSRPTVENFLDRQATPKRPSRAVTHEEVILRGVTFGDRQRVIARCGVHDRVIFRHEEGNPKDSNAISVETEGGRSIGYLPRGMGAAMIRKSASGSRYCGIIKKFLDPNEEYDSTGVVIYLIEAAPGASDDDAQDYVDAMLRRRA